MPPSKIMIIRHAEKPARSDDKSLSVRGWQRAGALAVLFAPGPLTRLRQECAQPNWIYASGTLTSGSLRPQQTVEPLAQKLRVDVNTSYNPSRKPDTGNVTTEGDLIREALTKSGVVLISWQHELIPALASHIPLAPGVTYPAEWSSDRFDLIWIFDLVSDSEEASPLYGFAELPQELLAGDI